MKIKAECQKLTTVQTRPDLWLLPFFVLTATDRQSAELLGCCDLLTLGLHLQQRRKENETFGAISYLTDIPPSPFPAEGQQYPKGARQLNSLIIQWLGLKVTPVQQLHPAACETCMDRPRPTRQWDEPFQNIETSIDNWFFSVTVSSRDSHENHNFLPWLVLMPQWG